MEGHVNTVIDVSGSAEEMGHRLGEAILAFLTTYYSLKSSGLEKKMVGLLDELTEEQQSEILKGMVFSRRSGHCGVIGQSLVQRSWICPLCPATVSNVPAT